MPPSSPNDLSGDLSPEDAFKKGVDEFNQQAFYACHDTLETIWMEAEFAEKAFYQGILQVAVGLYHLGNLNWRGSAILLGEGINRLRQFEPIYKGIVVDDLVDQSADWLALVQSAGPEGLEAMMADLPQSLPQIQWETGLIKRPHEAGI